jgi:hypothetical protein
MKNVRLCVVRSRTGRGSGIKPQPSSGGGFQRSVDILYPKIPPASVRALLGYALAGAMLAGLYGVVHDEITYSIGPEYFTRLKFQQFHYADFGLAPRVLAAEIGFLATWWVGLLAGWFIARVSVPAFSPAAALRHSARGFLIVFAFALTASLGGYLLGLLHGSDYSTWEGLASRLGIVDLPNFVRVAYIHNAAYLGVVIGLIAAIIHLRKLKNMAQPLR